MITVAFVTMMAAYNAELNRRLYAAASRLSEAERRADRGAFWKSIHGTFNHLLWSDQQWMSRFAAWPKPAVGLAKSDTLIDDFAELTEARIKADAAIEAWAQTLDAAWLAEDQVWFSGAAQRDLRKPRGLLLTHMFNHQTHHRGQAHALLTGFGQATGDTDLFLVFDG